MSSLVRHAGDPRDPRQPAAGAPATPRASGRRGHGATFVTRLLTAALTFLAALAPPARAQDFAPASASGPQPGADALLERALPDAASHFAFESSVTRWLALPALETRASAAELAAGAARFAIGLAQTGDPELGWTSVALGAGAACADAGGALRVLARHDRDAGAIGSGRLARGGGLEAGAGAWIEPSPGVTLWASAPQFATAGEPPPLARPLELGVRVREGEASAWASVLAPNAGDGERAAGVSLAAGPLELWIEGRDAPLRASVGARIRARALVVETRIDAHPVLGETSRLALAWRPEAHARTRRHRAAAPPAKAAAP